MTVRRWVATGVAVVVALIVVGLIWIAVTADQARRDIANAQAQLTPLRTAIEGGHDATATKLLDEVRRDADAASSKTTGPAWWFGSQVPWLGRPLRVVRDGAATVSQVVDGAQPIATALFPKLSVSSLRHGHTIALSRISAAEPDVAKLARLVASARVRADALPAHTWLGAANHSRDELVGDVDRLDTSLASLTKGMQELPALLGANGPRTYLVVFENEAESRGLGGLPGAYGVMAADHGRVHFVRFGNDTSFTRAAKVQLPAGFENIYDRSFGAARDVRNSDMSPNFPTDAKILLSMYQQQFGTRLDGVVATDPTALGYLLAAAGPVKLTDGVTLDSDNIVAEMEQEVYATYADDNPARKRFVVQAAAAAAQDLFSSHGDAGALFDGLRKAADQRRLLVYSTDPRTESWLSSATIGGALPNTDRPFSAVAIDNGTGSKLDYYLKSSVDYRRDTCAATESLTTVTLDNTAPTSGLPPYVSQHAAYPDQPAGYNDLLLFLYATKGAHITSITVNGVSTPFSQGVEAGHPVADLEVPIDPGQTVTIGFYVHEPKATGALVRVIQPMVQPQTVTESGVRC